MSLSIDQATDYQRQAADPSRTRLVSANAGSGKTKVLVDRVSRILLTGTDPDKILCLTYTRAAASEMQERLYKQLGDWSVFDKEKLISQIEKLFGQPFGEITPQLDLDQIRTLFARALETPEGLKVMTIHAFCDRILARFPIEAGIMPGFSPLDDAGQRELKQTVAAQLLRDCAKDPELSQALAIVTRLKANQDFDALLDWMAGSVADIQAWQDAGGVDALAKAAGFETLPDPTDIAEKAWARTDLVRVEAIRDLCRQRPGRWNDRVERQLSASLDAAERNQFDQAFRHYSRVFLKSDGSEPTSQIATKAVNDIDDYLMHTGDEASRVVETFQTIMAAENLRQTQAVLTLAERYADLYTTAKHESRVLDFNDQVLKARDLLTRRDVSDWVAFKLDGGVEHILLDEAQDTAPEQWDIIDAIRENFAFDPPDREAALDRSFFAVGDVKQSIYRFQGAAPKLFMERFQSIAKSDEVRLSMSFRSMPEVLAVVDALFIDQRGLQAMFDPDSLPPSSDLYRHISAREGRPGVVELWPLAPKSASEDEREAWDTTPVDALNETDPKVRLARVIAAKAKQWIDAERPIFDRDLNQKKGGYRPIHAGDILILVQKRTGGLFEAIIRELKRAGLPVAGADRLTLQDAVIVRDLLAMTRFVLLPSDDLSLAEVLKSPLFGLDDDALFKLCVDRGTASVWETIQERDPGLASALSDILDLSDAAPYDFYARLLDRRSPSGQTYRAALYQRLGMESREALEAFLAIALDHGHQEAPSLQLFMRAFTEGDVEIKRDKDGAGAEIRIMTVHGAKGLEAPVVILPDTTRAPKTTFRDPIRVDGGFLLAPSSSGDYPAAVMAKDAERDEVMQEYMRLLYVAMTRAESELIVCGHHHGNGKAGFAGESWYHWMMRTMDALDCQSFETPFDGEGRQGLRFGRRVTRDDLKGLKRQGEGSATGSKTNTAPLPSWINEPAQREIERHREATPSGLLARNARPISPARRKPSGVMRGIVIHKMLELLPDVPADQRRARAADMLRAYPDFGQGDQTALNAAGERLIDEALQVIENPDFAPIFSPGSRAEVTLAGRVPSLQNGNLLLTAQIDRMAVTPDRVLIVDYKSGRGAPDHANQTDPAYLAQLVAYRELARSIYPDRDIVCGLLYTSGPALQWIDDAVLEPILTQVNAEPS